MREGILSAYGTQIALAISTTIVDASPFSLYGATVLAIMGMHPMVDVSIFRKQLLYWGLAMLLICPFLAWLLFMAK